MEVILQADYPSLGYVGDRVKVANGFARNFLLPRGVAIEANGRNERQIQHLLGGINVKKAKLRAEATSIGQRLEKVALEFSLKVGDGGKVFGSVTTKDIEAALKTKGFEILRKQIRLTEPLRKAGDYTVTIKLHSEVSASMAIKLVTEGAPVPQEATEEGAAGQKAKRGGRGRKSKKGEETATGDEQSKTEAAPEK